MALLHSTFHLIFLLSNVWTSYKTLKPPPLSKRREGPSQKALATRKRELKSCLAVWIVWVTWSCAESIADRSVGMVIPFYSDIKAVFLIVLFFTRALVAEPLLLHVIRPTLKPYIRTIDSVLSLMDAIAHIVIYFALAPWRYVSSWWNEPVHIRVSDTKDPVPAEIEEPVETVVFQTAQGPQPVHTQPVPAKVPATTGTSIPKPPSTVGIRTRRGMNPVVNDPKPSRVPMRKTSQLPLKAESPIDITPIAIPQPPPPQPFVVRSVAPPQTNSYPPLLTPEPSMFRPTFVPSTPPAAPTALPQALNPDVGRTPRFPGGYARSTTEQSETDQSVTVVPSLPSHSPPTQTFSFPEPPPIEMYAPGSSRPSELPRSRLRTLSARSPPTPPLTPPILPVAPPPVEPLPTPPSSFISFRPERAPAASSATAAAEAKRRKYAMLEPTLATTNVPLKRTPSITENGPKHPVSSATMARRQRLASVSSTAPGQAQGQAPSATARIDAMEPSIARSRAKPAAPAPAPTATPAPVVVPVVVPVASETAATSVYETASSASGASSSSGSSRRSSRVAAGKKRSAKGQIVETPRLPPSASEVESATEGEGDGKAESTASAKKKRKVDSPIEPTPVTQIPVAVAVPEPRPVEVVAKQSEPPRPKHKLVEDIAMAVEEEEDYSDDDSWSALDELKTPRPLKGRVLRGGSVFSDDDGSPVPPPRPALSVAIPAPKVTPVPLTGTTLSTISDFPHPLPPARPDVFDSKSISTTQSQTRTSNTGSQAPPIQVTRGNSAAAARGIRLRRNVGGL